MNRPAVFFDRDNTLILSDGYLGDPDAVVLVQGAAQAVARVRAAGFAVVVFSNQSGVARGLFTEEDVHRVNAKLDEVLRDHDPGAVIDRHEFCPHHPEAAVPRYRQASEFRKPAPGMIYQAARQLGLHLGRSWVVGDAPRDIEAGRAAGCRTILFKDPAIPPSPAAKSAPTVAPDYVVATLIEAAEMIEREAAKDRTGEAADKAEPEETKEIKETKETEEPEAEARTGPGPERPGVEDVAEEGRATAGGAAEAGMPDIEVSHLEVSDVEVSDAIAVDAGTEEAGTAEAGTAEAAIPPPRERVLEPGGATEGGPSAVASAAETATPMELALPVEATEAAPPDGPAERPEIETASPEPSVVEPPAAPARETLAEAAAEPSEQTFSVPSIEGIEEHVPAAGEATAAELPAPEAASGQEPKAVPDESAAPPDSTVPAPTSADHPAEESAEESAKPRGEPVAESVTKPAEPLEPVAESPPHHSEPESEPEMESAESAESLESEPLPDTPRRWSPPAVILAAKAAREAARNSHPDASPEALREAARQAAREAAMGLAGVPHEAASSTVEPPGEESAVAASEPDVSPSGPEPTREAGVAGGEEHREHGGGASPSGPPPTGQQADRPAETSARAPVPALPLEYSGPGGARRSSESGQRRLEELAEQILQELKNRNDAANDFSVSKLMAGITMVLSLAVLICAYLYKDSPQTLQSFLLLGVMLQALTISLLIMGRQR